MNSQEKRRSEMSDHLEGAYNRALKSPEMKKVEQRVDDAVDNLREALAPGSSLERCKTLLRELESALRERRDKSAKEILLAAHEEIKREISREIKETV